MSFPEIVVNVNDPEEIVVYVNDPGAIKVVIGGIASEQIAELILYDPVTKEPIWQLITKNGLRVWQKKVGEDWIDYDEW